MDSPSLVTRAERIYEAAAGGRALAPGALAALCSQHRDLAPVLQQVDFVFRHLAGGAAPETAPIVSGYTLGERLGQGGMGVVWAARHEALDRMVAIKVLAADLENDSEHRARLLREAQAMAQVRHQHVVPVYDVIDSDGMLAIAMELVPGADLGAILGAWSEASAPTDPSAVLGELLGDDQWGDREPFPGVVATLVRWGNEVAQALSAAHAAGLLHRDVKPSNIRVRAGDRRALLLDFGVARRIDERTRTSGFVGTPRFAAPEQLVGKPVDERTDIYSLGSTLHGALFRALGGRGEPAPAGRPIPLGTLGGKATPDLDAVLGKALEPDPRDRYPSADAMARDLAAVLAGDAVHARPRGRALRAAHWVLRDKLRLGLLTALVVAAVLGAVLWREWPRLVAGRQLEHRAAVEVGLQKGFRLLIDPAQRRDAAAAFAEVQQLAPGEPDAVLGRIGALVLAGDSEAAHAAVAAAPHLTAQVPELQRLVSDDLASTPGGAAPTSAREVTPSRAMVLYLLALRTDAREDFAAAAMAMEDLQFRVDAARELHFGIMAYAAARAGDSILLERATAGLATLWPESAAAQAWIAMATHESDPARALTAARRAMALDPSLENYLLPLALNLSRIDDPAGAETELQAALRRRPDDPSLLVLRGDAWARAGQPDQAAAAYRRAIDAAPDHLGARSALAQLLWAERPEAALEELRELARLAPSAPATWRNLGMVLLKTKDYAGARDALEACIGLTPADGIAVSMLGEALFHLQAPTAADVLLRAADLAPDSARAPWFLSQIHAADRDFAGAVEHLEEALRRLDAGGMGVRRSSVERALDRLRRR